MSFFRNVGGGLKDFFTNEGPGAFEEIAGLARGGRNLLNPKALQFIFGLRDESPFAPQAGVDLTTVRTPDQARAAIDTMLGIEGNRGIRLQAQAIDWFKNQGGYTSVLRVFTGDPTAELSGLPFTATGDGLQATGGFPRDPVLMLDLQLNEQLQRPENQALAIQYLREVDPMTLLPDLVVAEREMRILGNEKSNNFFDIIGRPFAAAKDIGVALIFGATVDRLEEVLGEGYYQNAIPDPYLRQVMAKRLYDFNVFEFWDTDHEHEREAIQKAEEILARGDPSGEASAKEFEQYLRDNNLGAAGFLSDIAGKILTDPLWAIGGFVLPAKLGLAGIERVTGRVAPNIKFLPRLTTPGGRAARSAANERLTEEGFRTYLGLRGVSAVMKMPEISYQQAKLAVPVKGITRLFVERTPALQGQAARTTIELRLAPVTDQLVENPALISEIGETLKTGTPTKWVSENLPDFLNHPVMAQLSATAREAKANIFEQTFESFIRSTDVMTQAGWLRPGVTEEAAQQLLRQGEKIVPPSEISQTLRVLMSQAALEFSEKSMQTLWNQSATGRFLTKYWFPMTGFVRSATAAVTINNPGFIWLNMVSNGVRLAWHSAWHPLLGADAFARSLTLETGTIFKGGGRYPQIWERMLAATGLTPLDVERNVSRVTGAHDLLGRTVTKIVTDPEFLTDDAFATIRKAMLQPGKEIGARSRFIDRFMAPVYVASRVDKLFRRATFMSQLRKQYHLGTAPGGAFENLWGPMRGSLKARGVADDQIEILEAGFADEVRGFVFGTRDLPGGRALGKTEIRQVLEDRIVRVEAGDLSAQLSAYEIGQDFAKVRLGLDDARAQAFAVDDLSEFIDWANHEVMPMLDQAQKAASPEAFLEVFSKIERMAQGKALEYDIPADMIRQLSRIPRIQRGKTTYAGALRVTNEGIRRDLVDTFQHLDRLMGVVKGEAWASKRPVVWQQARQLAGLAENAITENVRRLESIQQVYTRLGQESLERVGRHTVISRELAEELLQEDLRTGAGLGAARASREETVDIITAVQRGERPSVYSADDLDELNRLVQADTVGQLNPTERSRLAALRLRMQGRPPPATDTAISDALATVPRRTDAQITSQLTTPAVPVPPNEIPEGWVTAAASGPRQASYNDGIFQMLKRVEGDVEEFTAIAGMDPRIIEILRGNLYDGDLGQITMKELLQNSFDAIRPMGAAGRIRILYDRVAGTFTITDNGVGMLPDVARQQFINVGGSLKNLGDTGGFGVAKVAYMGNAESLEVRTVARAPDGELIETTMRGSGNQWLRGQGEGGLTGTIRRNVDDAEPGFEMTVKMREDVETQPYLVNQWAARFQEFSELEGKIEILNVRPGGIGTGGPVLEPVLDPTIVPEVLPELTRFSVDGADVIVRASTDTVTSGAIEPHILNSGMYQYTGEGHAAFYMRRPVPIPRTVVLDVKAHADPTAPNYPFSPNREGLRGAAKEQLDQYFKREFFEAAARTEDEQIRRAMDTAVFIEGPLQQHKIVDTNTNLPRAFMDRLAGRAYAADITALTQRFHDEMEEFVRISRLEFGRPDSPARFFGLGFGPDYAGIHINLGRVIEGEEAIILVNPFNLAGEVGRLVENNIINEGQRAEWLARRLIGTMTHEEGHRVVGGHLDDFAGVLTRVAGDSSDLQARFVGEATEMFRRMEDTGELARLIDDATEWESFGAGTNIFKRNSDSVGRPTGSGYGPALIGERGEEGPRLTEALRPTGRGPASPLASRPTVGGRSAEDVVRIVDDATVLDPESTLADVFEILEVDAAFHERQFGLRVGNGSVPARRLAAEQRARLQVLDEMSKLRIDGLDDDAIVNRFLDELGPGVADSTAGRMVFGSLRDLDDARIGLRAGRNGITDEQLHLSALVDAYEDIIVQHANGLGFPRGTLIREGPEEVAAALRKSIAERRPVGVAEVQRPRAITEFEAAQRPAPVVPPQTAKAVGQPELAGRPPLTVNEAQAIAARQTEPRQFWELVLGRRLTQKEANVLTRAAKRQADPQVRRFALTREGKAKTALEDSLESELRLRATREGITAPSTQDLVAAGSVDELTDDSLVTFIERIDEVQSGGDRRALDELMDRFEVESQAMLDLQVGGDPALANRFPRANETLEARFANIVPDVPVVPERITVLQREFAEINARIDDLDNQIDTILEAGGRQQEVRLLTETRDSLDEQLAGVRRQLEDAGAVVPEGVEPAAAAGGAAPPPTEPPAPPGGPPEGPLGPPPPPTGDEGITVGQVWENYFNRRDGTWDDLYRFIEEQIGVSSEPHLRIAQQLRELARKTFREHRKILQRALEGGDDRAWQVAGEEVRNLYQNTAQRRGSIAGWGPNDPPKAMEGTAGGFDTSGVLAREVQEFSEFFVDKLRLNADSILRGERVIEPESTRALREAADVAAANWPEARDTMIANAKMATDFVMLNYLDQTGGDRLFQTVFPFEFWPTRDAFNWAIRGAKAPGAFGALSIMMFNTDDVARQYGYPERLQNRIPIPLPGFNEFVRDFPGLGRLVEDGDFAPIFFVDPMRFIFPYTFLRDGFDNDARRNTPAGRALDFFNNNTPLNAGPFQTFIGRNTGLLDKDAWRSTYLSGGPFGLPTTAVARATARFVFAGDNDAIPESEQALYIEKGHFGPGWLRDILGMDDDKFAVWRAERALASLVATGELIPGAPKEEQLDKAWIALDSHTGPEWRKAVKTSQSETNLRRMTQWIGFPFGDLVGVNEGEMIWFGLKAMFAEASRRGQLGAFFEKFPEFELRSAAVRGLSDPEEKEKAIDTELYYQSLERFVNQPVEHQIMDLENERDRLRNLTQSQEVRDQINVLDDELRVIRDQQEERRDILDRAFPFRETELSINRSPRERVLRVVRGEWFDIDWEPGEPFEAFTTRREQFLSQFPSVTDRLGLEMAWQELEVAALRVKIRANRDRDQAFARNDFDRANQISAERDAVLEDLHVQARVLITRQDVERYLGSLAEVKTAEEKEFDNADALFDFWMSLVGDGSLFSSRERAAISAYFRGLPEIQKYFPLSAVDLDELSTEQRLAIMRRRDFWRTYNSIRDANTKLDYLRLMKPEVDRANRLLGLPPIEILDIDAYPPESGGDPLFDHIAFMSALNREREISGDESLSEEERQALSQLSARVGFDQSDTALSGDDITRYVTPYSMADLETVP